MEHILSPAELDILRRYSAGQSGTRDTTERLGFHDYADLIIALAKNDLDFPRPAPRRPSGARPRDAAAASASWRLRSG